MLQKQAVDISFAQGLDQKTDRKRIQMGKFERLENTVFNKGGLLQKRNGYQRLSTLPDTTYSYLTTFKENLTAVGQNIAAYNPTSASWVTKGSLEPLSLSTLSLIKNNYNQSDCDAAVSSNGTMCTVYLESTGAVVTVKYVVSNVATGQNITAPRAIPVASGSVTGAVRVFILKNNFVIVFTNVITGVEHLQYITVNIYTPTIVSSNVDIATVPIGQFSWEGVVVNDRLFLAYNTTTGGQSIKVRYLTSTLVLSAAVTFAGSIATIMSVTADMTNPATPIIYATFYDSAGSTGYTLAVDQNLNTVLSPTQYLAAGTILNIATAAANGSVAIFYEVSNVYSWNGGATSIPSNFISAKTVTVAGVVSAAVVVIRSVGLASKAFLIDGEAYFLTVFSSPYQPSYFLINGSLSRSSSPVIAAKLAYSNGGGYLTFGVPSVSLIGSSAYIPYLIKDLVTSVNKGTAVPAGTQVNGIYSQTGVNLANFTFGTSKLDTSEIGNDLHITGGYLSMYDGYLPVEDNFFVWPDTSSTSTLNATWSATGGSMAAEPSGSGNTSVYYYQFVYEWTDNQGNAFRSSPSIPVPVTTTGSGTSGSVSLYVPTLRLTMKVANPVKIVVYRWSVGQQIYYQTTSITSPTLNDTTADSVHIVDVNSDATILGNNILYTTGGVVENTNAPASDILALFDTRLWLVDAEDPNLLWFSKQVIEGTPVEMSDLFTKYIPPTTATKGSTGPIKSLFPMDDKLIIGKKDAFLYINGAGPDNTGANNQYSDPIFITATVGCENQKSIALIPQGTMFQSDKGIWLLDRSLSTSYIGAPVEDLTQGATVLSAVSVPGTNQVRFTLDNGYTLMYDYYYQQWGSFTGISGVSSCIFDDMHTYINSVGQVYQEALNYYLDGSLPVLMAFKTGPLRLGDLQNYQRAYFFYILGTYLSPHKLDIGLYYDYSVDASQRVLISPINYSTPYGEGDSQSPFGQGTPFGGPSNLESWRVFLERQRCMAFAISLQEIFDSSLGTVAGAGLTISGLNVVMGMKKGFRPQDTQTSVG